MDLIRAAWRKSSYSTGNGGDCVEVATTWRKSTYSSGNGGACVEVGTAPRAVSVRDSKDPEGPVLAFSRYGWLAFTHDIKSGAGRA